MNKPEIKEIFYKDKTYGSVNQLWLISYTKIFFYCPFDVKIKCYYCGKSVSYFIFVKERDTEFGFMACPNCLQYSMDKIKDPISYPIKFFPDI